MDEKIVEQLIRLAFRIGFAATREGFNGECPYDHLAPAGFKDRNDIERAVVQAFDTATMDELLKHVSK